MRQFGVGVRGGGRPGRGRRVGVVSLAALVVVAGMGVAQACVTLPGAPAGSGRAGSGGAGFDRTSATEARRVDSVMVPKLTWAPCTTKIRTKVECSGIDLPLDYDHPGRVMCSDSLNPTNPSAWIRAGRQADQRAPYFGWLHVWDSVACARDLWTAQDGNRYPGPFDRRTAHPVLFVGNYYDPATSYQDGAVTAARRLPGSRLLTSDSWGHAAYGTSRCVTDAVDAYLIHRTLPAPGTVCTGPQPFQDSARNR